MTASETPSRRETPSKWRRGCGEAEEEAEEEEGERIDIPNKGNPVCRFFRRQQHA